MRLNAHLSFHGECEAAFRFYEECLDGKIAFQLTYAETPMAGDVPEEWRGKILHVRLDVGNDILTGADSWPGDAKAMKGFTMALHFNDAAQVERVFGRLAEGGKVTMPLQKTFWTSHFGVLTDRFGVPWMIIFNNQA
jgi:PhnB protein